MTGSGLISLVIQLAIAGLIFWLILWFVDYVSVPDPFNKVIKVIVGLIVLLFLLNILLGFTGRSVVLWR